MFQHDPEAKLIALPNGAISYEMPDSALWYGVDFDGTLAFYDSEWRGVEYTGEPLTPMVDKVKELLEEGRNVRIFTARVNDILHFIHVNLPPYRRDKALQDKIKIDLLARSVIEQWCLINIGRVLPITNTKDAWCRGIYDDIAIQMVPNTGKTLAVPEQAEYLASRGATPEA